MEGLPFAPVVSDAGSILLDPLVYRVLTPIAAHGVGEAYHTLGEMGKNPTQKPSKGEVHRCGKTKS